MQSIIYLFKYVLSSLSATSVHLRKCMHALSEWVHKALDGKESTCPRENKGSFKYEPSPKS